MMDSPNSPAALRQAIEILYVPSQVRLLKSAPLPKGLPLLLRIAAGDVEAERQARTLTDRPRDVIRKAAAFFIEQILLHPDADYYRVLGASPEASGQELRHNMALLLKWLHPDVDGNGARSVLARRVTMAWDVLRSPERRADYDTALQRARRRARSTRRYAAPLRIKVAAAHDRHDDERADLLRRGFSILLGRAWR